MQRKLAISIFCEQVGHRNILTYRCGMAGRRQIIHLDHGRTTPRSACQRVEEPSVADASLSSVRRLAQAERLRQATHTHTHFTARVGATMDNRRSRAGSAAAFKVRARSVARGTEGCGVNGARAGRLHVPLLITGVPFVSAGVQPAAESNRTAEFVEIFVEIADGCSDPLASL